MEFGSGFSPWYDGIRRSLERHNSAIGDNLSDTYRDLVDAATDPNAGHVRYGHAGRLLTQLGQNATFIEMSLGWGAYMYDTPDLIGQYRGALQQVGQIIGFLVE